MGEHVILKEFVFSNVSQQGQLYSHSPRVHVPLAPQPSHKFHFHYKLLLSQNKCEIFSILVNKFTCNMS